MPAGTGLIVGKQFHAGIDENDTVDELTRVGMEPNMALQQWTDGNL